MIDVVVADDQSLVRGGITMMLDAQPDICVVGEATDGREAVEAAARLVPDVMLMDLRMPTMDGIDATAQIVAGQDPGDRRTRILVLTTFNDDDLVYGALRAGASGFLLKHAAPEDLVAAVRIVASGRSYLDPEVTATVIRAVGHDLGGSSGASAEQLTPLTAREREVLGLMALGLTNHQISDQLVLSEATVKTHVARILMKTGSHDRTQAVVLAYRSGLVPTGRRPGAADRP